MQEHAETGEKQVGEVRNQVTGRFGFDRKRQITPPNTWQELLVCLNRTFGPAVLLRFETVHVHRQLGRRHNVGQKNEFPAGKLRAVAQIEIFAKRVVLPTTGFFDACLSPQTGRAVKIEKAAAPAARGLLEHKMAV